MSRGSIGGERLATDFQWQYSLLLVCDGVWRLLAILRDCGRVEAKRNLKHRPIGARLYSWQRSRSRIQIVAEEMAGTSRVSSRS
jgi:hypothetical protein